jgi:hypothetical protein
MDGIIGKTIYILTIPIFFFMFALYGILRIGLSKTPPTEQFSCFIQIKHGSFQIQKLKNITPSLLMYHQAGDSLCTGSFYLLDKSVIEYVISTDFKQHILHLSNKKTHEN